MGSKKTKTTSNETATTTPNVPDFFKQPVENYFGNVVSPLINPNADVLAPINDLQSSAFNMAGSLGNNASGYNDALGLLGNATKSLSQRVNTQAQTAALPSVASVPGMPTQLAQMPTAPGVTKVAGPQGIASILAPEARQASIGNYGPVSLAQDTSGLAGKDVATFGGAGASGFLSQYMNSPELQNYISATLAEYDDQAGREKQSFAAEGARNNSFGGSRYAIGEAQLASDLTRKRALTAAELRDQAYTRALQAAQGDAANANSAGIASMQAQNQRQETLADLASRLGIFNAGAQNDRAKSMFDAETDLSRFNASEGNDLLSQIFGEQNTNARAEFDALTGNARQDAGAANDLARQVYGTQADMNQFNTGAVNEGLRFDIANALNMNQFNAGMQADLNQFNTGQLNNMAQFNTTANQNNARSLLDAANSRTQIAGAMGDDQRANIASLLATGNAQQDAQTQQMLEPYIRAGLLGDLLDPSLAGLFTGNTATADKTGTSKESGGLGAALIGGLASLGSAAITKSERRVKRDIVKLGEEADGLGVYRYNYIWDDVSQPVRFGVMVDEVERIRPWALGPVVDGVQTVDYGRL